MIIKKCICVLITVFSLIICCSISAFAADYVICADDVNAMPGTEINIPIKIQDNKGIMGFKLTVEYPDNIIKATKVMRGTVTNEGMLENSISEATSGVFDIVWNNTENVNEDGTVCLIQFHINSDAKSGDYKIKLSYSQPDTFNESWDDVVLNLKNVVVHVAKQDDKPQVTIQETTKATENSTVKIDNEAAIENVLEIVDSDYVQESIENAMESVGASTIEDMSDDQFNEFQSTVNDLLSVYDVEIDTEQTDKDDFSGLYSEAVEESFINDVISSVDSDVINETITNALTEYGAGNIDDLPKEKYDLFIETIQKALKDKNAEFDELPDNVDKLKIIQKLYERANNDEGEKQIASSDDNKKISIVVMAIVALVIVFAVIGAVNIKNKRRTN